MPANLPALHSTGQPGTDRLGLALLLAMVLHGGLIFGVGFEKDNRQAPSSTLEITLARHRSAVAPEDAEHIASHNQLASGDQQESRPITSDEIALLESTELRDVDPLSEPYLPEQSPFAPSDALVSSNDGGTPPVQAQPGETAHRQAEIPANRVREIASLRARLDQQKQAYSKLPRTLVLTSVSARSSDQADYLYNWIEWVEKVGNENYPEEARRKTLFGELRLAVSIGRDGGVEGIEILHSSGQRVLDQAAIRTVRLAAPFAPLPPSLGVDRIEVIRTWRFVPGHQFSSSNE